MSLEHFSALWAPWRAAYFEQPRSGNFLLEAARSNDDRSHFVLARRKTSFLMLNGFPYAVGHMMAVPYREVAELDALGENEQLEIFALAILAQRLLRCAMKAQGFNVGFNLGACAGAGIAGHLHLHIVPRWEGDNNFMPVLSGTRVLPEALSDAYDRLMAAQAEIAPPLR